MTPRQAGEMLGFVAGEVLGLAIVWLVIVLVTLFVARLLRRRLTLRGAAGNAWILGIVAALFVVQMISRLGGR
jgi:cell division protein FtsW (lipid II flippase)